MQYIWYTALSAYKSLWCFIYASAPVSKFNTNKLTKMRAIPQRKQHFPVSTTHKNTHYWHCSIHLNALVDSIFRGWIWTLMCRFTRVITIVREADLIKIISSYTTRVWPDWVYMMCCCQATWRVYQASAGTGTGNKQHCLPLTKLLIVSLISPLFAKNKTISHLP